MECKHRTKLGQTGKEASIEKRDRVKETKSNRCEQRLS